MRIDTSGNVGVGTSTTTTAFVGYGQVGISGATGGAMLLQSAGATKGGMVSDASFTYLYSLGSAPLLFGVGGTGTGTERMRIDTNGALGIGLTPVTSGNNRGLLQLAGCANGGIYLGNTANAATNVLDHYEEGTFTFVPVGLSTAGAPSGTTINGNFIRIGKLVHITGTASWSSHTGTGTLQMSGLPYAAASVMPVAMTVHLIGPTYSGIPHAEIQIGTSNIRIVQQASGAGSTYLSVPSGATTININGSYFVA